MEKRETAERSTSSRWPLALAATAVAVVGILAAAGLYVFKSARQIPKDVLHDLKDIAQAFRTGTVTTSFVSYATEVSGSNRLQFATLRQMEVFERKDSVAVFWGRLELPEVIVEARAPVEYTYYLDLDARWEFRLEGSTIRVLAPEIRFNAPAIDASAIRYEVRAGSIFRREQEVLDRLREGLTEAAKYRARENIALVRELGRRKTAEFVEKWLARSFTDKETYRVEVVFADERPSPLREGQER
jgi:hypothetical protein